MYIHVHLLTHTTHTQQSLQLPLGGHTAQWPALGHLCATQVLWVSAGMSSWGRTSNPRETVPCLTGEGVGTQSPTWTFNCYMRHGQFSICFPSKHQVPIDVTAGWAASPVGTRPPGPHFNSWVDWSNVSKISCSRKQQHQSGPAGNRTWSLMITRWTP